MDLKIRSPGLSARPVDGWPLDHVLVGVATLRAVRQVLRPPPYDLESFRAWDLALRTDITPQGAVHCMERLERAGIVREVRPFRAWHATTYAVVDDHPLVFPLSSLFAVERAIAGPMIGLGRRGRVVDRWPGRPAGPATGRMSRGIAAEPRGTQPRGDETRPT